MLDDRIASEEWGRVKVRRGNILTSIWRIEKERRWLRTLNTEIVPDEYLPRPEFAGKYTIGEFAKDTSAWWKCMILWWLCRGKMQVLELGTGVGIGTAYMAVDVKDIVITVEADAHRAGLAEQVSERVGVRNHIYAVEDSFANVIQAIRDRSITPISVVYIDGEHTGEALIRYFTSVLPLLQNGGAIVVDDILWSRNMRLAWDNIKHHPAVLRSFKIHDFGVLKVRGGR